MMIDRALRLADLGFWVFRIKPNGKTPFAKGWQDEATRDPAQLKKLWGECANANIGIFTSRYKDDQALVAVDVDDKDGRNGSSNLIQLDFEGKVFPRTFTQTTASGGRHLLYFANVPVKQGANVLASGLDIRSRGGYVVASGSNIEGKNYLDDAGSVVEAPEWMTTELTQVAAEERKEVDATKINRDAATERALEYLATVAPSPEEGTRNDTAYRVANVVKDKGVLEDEAQELMSEWNENLEDPLDDDELHTVVHSAYRTGANAPGSKAPEVVFNKVDVPAVERKEAVSDARHPFQVLNERYAFVLAGGGHHILYETTNEKGHFRLEHLQEASFHKSMAWYQMAVGKGAEPVTKLWLQDRDARRYEGLVFSPGRDVDKRFYNMWRGFSFKPKAREEVSEEARWAVDEYFNHARDNVAQGDAEMYNYLVGWLAHLIQFPGEKPLVALVLKGEKGVGKNVVFRFIAPLLGGHAMVTPRKRFLISHFNSHMESLLLFVLDEAFWSGDKEAESVLKDLITGQTHTIERKGIESYEVDNLTRCGILGNENWLVPASEDERRFAVFNVGNGRKQDVAYFTRMRKGMQAGGQEYLLHRLLNIDITKFNVDKAPNSQGLADQKMASLTPISQWWLDSLTSMRFAGAAGFKGATFEAMDLDAMRTSLSYYCRSRNISARIPDDRTILREIRKYAPSLMRAAETDGVVRFLNPGGLELLRQDWMRFIGGKVDFYQTLDVFG